MDQSQINRFQARQKLPLYGHTRAVFIALAVISCILIGVSGFAYPSAYAPLLVGAAYVGVAALVVFVRKPTWALYAAIIVVFLPIGLIPPNIQSQINRTLAVAAFAVWVIDAIAHHRRFVWKITMYMMVAFLLWCLLTTVWSVDHTNSLAMIQVYVLRMMLFLIVIPNEIETKQDLDGLMKTLAVIGWLMMGISLVFLVVYGGYTPGSRLKILDQNQNTLGAVFLLALPGILWNTVQPGKNTRFQTYTAMAFILLAIILTFLSGSRGSTISMIISMFIFYLFKPTRAWGKTSLLVLLLAGLVAPFAFTTIINRFLVTQGDTFLGGRETIWQAGLLLIKDHPWFGVGIGNSPYAVLPYLRFFQSLFTQSQVSQDPMSPLHNPVLVILSETGIPGLLIYLSVMGSAVLLFLNKFYQAVKQDDPVLVPYCALIFSIYIGSMATWIKGGGMESDYSYFLVLGLLLIPSGLNIKNTDTTIIVQK